MSYISPTEVKTCIHVVTSSGSTDIGAQNDISGATPTSLVNNSTITPHPNAQNPSANTSAEPKACCLSQLICSIARWLVLIGTFGLFDLFPKKQTTAQQEEPQDPEHIFPNEAERSPEVVDTSFSTKATVIEVNEDHVEIHEPPTSSSGSAAHSASDSANDLTVHQNNDAANTQPSSNTSEAHPAILTVTEVSKLSQPSHSGVSSNTPNSSHIPLMGTLPSVSPAAPTPPTLSYIDSKTVKATFTSKKARDAWLKTNTPHELPFSRMIVDIRDPDAPSFLLRLNPKKESKDVIISDVLRDANLQCDKVPPNRAFTEILDQKIWTIGERKFMFIEYLGKGNTFEDVFKAQTVEEWPYPQIIKVISDRNKYEEYQKYVRLQSLGMHENIVGITCTGTILTYPCVVMENYIQEANETNGITLGEYKQQGKTWSTDMERQYQSAVKFLSSANIYPLRKNDDKNVMVYPSWDNKWMHIKFINFAE